MARIREIKQKKCAGQTTFKSFRNQRQQEEARLQVKAALNLLSPEIGGVPLSIAPAHGNMVDNPKIKRA